MRQSIVAETSDVALAARCCGDDAHGQHLARPVGLVGGRINAAAILERLPRSMERFGHRIRGFRMKRGVSLGHQPYPVITSASLAAG
jgi:hypothetical protein